MLVVALGAGALTGIGLGLAFAPAALACSCAEVPKPEVAFTGVAVGGFDVSQFESEWVFNVVDAERGLRSAQVPVRGFASSDTNVGSSCSAGRPEPGGSYRVEASWVPDPSSGQFHLSASVCSGSFKEVAAGAHGGSGSGGSGIGSEVATAAGVAGVLGVAALLLMARRRQRPS